MNKISTTIVIILLFGIAILLLLSGLGIFPRYETVPVCPVDAISMVGQKAVIDSNKCIGCKRCVIGIKVPVKQKSIIDIGGALAVEDSLQPRTVQSERELSSSVAPVAAQKPIKNVKPVETAKSTKPKVNPDKCIGRKLCVIYCPVDAITMVKGKAVIDADKCIDCGICINGNGDDFDGCPVSAISKP
ncbi:MAG: 4Fe-4S binding protein [Candidatus Cloacimonadaceae bacterium]|nr:4Fe-4S binding protein [Candidatus Cloacimonadaceae bacterium]